MTLEDQASIGTIVTRLTPEFEGVFASETLERWVAESWEQLSGTAKVRAFLPVLAERFARERLRAVATVEGTIVSDTPEVLFVCVHNAGRSQMAAALLNWRAEGRVHVRSAGSDPTDEINPAVVVAMEELGLDLSQEFPKPLTDEFVRAADVVITMGCGDACPISPGKRYLDWTLDDPAGQSLEEVRRIRNDIDLRVQLLLDELSVGADERA
jgi:arsenate reductase